LKPVAAWAGCAALCRLAAVTLAVAAAGVGHDLRSGLVGLVALECSGLIPIAPGLAGVGVAAVGLALAADGVPSTTAIDAGIAFHVAEGVAGLTFGFVATLVLVLRRQLRFATPTPDLHRSLTHD
jgi:uncharacterized membrane protein YbhN (UPF0104 family)